MRDPMSPEFVFAFVETCMHEGLSKEAAAELLQRQSVIHASEQSPAFAEGYAQVADMAPGRLLPMLRDGYLSKEASGGLIRGGLKMMFKGLGGSLANTGTRAARGGNVAKGFIKRNPLSSAAAAAGTGGAAVYGLARVGPTDDSVPYLSPGGYDASETQAAYDKKLDQYSRGIGDLNQRYDNGVARMSKLEEAVARNDGNSGLAMQELQKLRRDNKAITKTRDAQLKKLDRSAETSDSRLNDIKEQQATLENAKTSWNPLRVAQRAWYGVTGRNADDVYDGRIAALQGQAGNASTNLQLANDTRARLNSGYTGTNGPAKVIDHAGLQDKFFPTYR